MLTVRPPAVAGLFYPGAPPALRLSVRALLDAAPRAAANDAECPKALIVPHAGYIYSGPIAASAYARLVPGRSLIRRVVLLGPVHRMPIRGLALPGADSFVTPLGAVPVDAEAAARLRVMPQVRESEAAHSLEHSLEVQLPFLQTMLEDFTLVPLAVGDASPSEVAEVIESLWGGPATLIDGFALCARRHCLKAELIDLRNSGDTAGEKSRVVGYAAFAFARKVPESVATRQVEETVDA